MSVFLFSNPFLTCWWASGGSRHKPTDSISYVHAAGGSKGASYLEKELVLITIFSPLEPTLLAGIKGLLNTTLDQYTRRWKGTEGSPEKLVLQHLDLQLHPQSLQGGLIPPHLRLLSRMKTLLHRRPS